MYIEIRIVGQGGQGIIKAGEILGKAFFYEKKNVIQSQSYSSEVRGGVSNADIIISDNNINNLVVSKPNIIILLSQEGMEKNISILKKSKIVIVANSIKNIPKIKGKIYKFPIINNVFALGVLCSLTDIIPKSALEKSIENSFHDFVNENLKALQEGYKFGKKIKKF